MPWSPPRTSQLSSIHLSSIELSSAQFSSVQLIRQREQTRAVSALNGKTSPTWTALSWNKICCPARCCQKSRYYYSYAYSYSYPHACSRVRPSVFPDSVQSVQIDLLCLLFAVIITEHERILNWKLYCIMYNVRKSSNIFEYSSASGMCRGKIKALTIQIWFN